jgi:hypothetical protein
VEKSRVYAGIKWGLQAPTALLAVRYWPSPRDHIQVIREAFKTEMMLEDAVAIAQEWHQELTVRKFYCDHKQPAFIKVMRRQRLWAVPVEVMDINFAINLVKKRLSNFEARRPGSLSFDLASTSRPGRAKPGPEDFICPNLMREFGRFRGRESKPNQPFRDVPLELDHYALSALHFLVLGLATEVMPRVRWL